MVLPPNEYLLKDKANKTPVATIAPTQAGNRIDVWRFSFNQASNNY
jgi:hypothetical protein